MANTTEDKLRKLQSTKLAIKNALISKGQTVSDNDTFRSYADKIVAIGTDPNVGFRVKYESGYINSVGEVLLCENVDQPYWDDSFQFAILQTGTSNNIVMCLVKKIDESGINFGQVINSSGGIINISVDDAVRITGTPLKGNYYWTVTSDAHMTGTAYNLFIFERVY